jgi:hypothetical protein
MRALLHAHSGFRYVVLAVAVIAVVYFLTAALRGRPFDKAARGLSAAFTGVLDLQVLMGLVLLLLFPYYPALLGHATMMLSAVVVAHVAAVINKRRPAERRSHALALVGVLVPLLLIVGGILSIGRPILGSGL